MQGTYQGIYQANSQENSGENARLQCYVGAIAIGDVMKSSFGPRGMDKILQSASDEPARKIPVITNDGATILGKILIDNPAAQILIDMSKRQDQRCGDGTTGVVILATEILRRAQQLVEQNLHPQTIVQGLRIAAAAAFKRLDEACLRFGEDDPQHAEVLLQMAMTTLNSKVLSSDRRHFAQLAVDAVAMLKNKNSLQLINVVKLAGARLCESQLVEGILIDKRLAYGAPKTITDARVLLANTALDADKIKIYGATACANDYERINELEDAEKRKMLAKIEAIAASGCNVFVNRQLVYDYPQQLLSQRKIACLQHADFDGMEALASALGAEIASTFKDSAAVQLGRCGKVEEVLIAEQRFTRFSQCQKPEACTVLLRGANEQVLAEAERSLHDALAVVSQTLQDFRLVHGGGAIEASIASAIAAEAQKLNNKTRLAVEAVADAFLAIPFIIMQNAGHDAADCVAQLKQAHGGAAVSDAGADVDSGAVASMQEKGVYESYAAKLYQLRAALEAAEQIIRVDAVIKSAPKQCSPH
uniref:T-complex protein 1 subunit beta n=1 Tax=Dermatophagoides pteronyssinus TaxID=6956 RepID=A0A6P6Y4E4_DERPT|nr:T-complex protein 1 subunit beta-like [Dermatophagoides pteronyssinus]